MIIIKAKAPGIKHLTVFAHIIDKYILSQYSGTPSLFSSEYAVMMVCDTIYDNRTHVNVAKV